MFEIETAFVWKKALHPEYHNPVITWLQTAGGPRRSSRGLAVVCFTAKWEALGSNPG